MPEKNTCILEPGNIKIIATPVAVIFPSNIEEGVIGPTLGLFPYPSHKIGREGNKLLCIYTPDAQSHSLQAIEITGVTPLVVGRDEPQSGEQKTYAQLRGHPTVSRRHILVAHLNARDDSYGIRNISGQSQVEIVEPQIVNQLTPLNTDSWVKVEANRAAIEVDFPFANKKYRFLLRVDPNINYQRLYINFPSSSQPGSTCSLDLPQNYYIISEKDQEDNIIISAAIVYNEGKFYVLNHYTRPGIGGYLRPLPKK